MKLKVKDPIDDRYYDLVEEFPGHFTYQPNRYTITPLKKKSGHICTWTWGIFDREQKTFIDSFPNKETAHFEAKRLNNAK